MNKEEGLNINISAPNLISVCVDASDRGEFSGAEQAGTSFFLTGIV